MTLNYIILELSMRKSRQNQYIYCATQLSKTEDIEICTSHNPAINRGYHTRPLERNQGQGLPSGFISLVLCLLF